MPRLSDDLWDLVIKAAGQVPLFDGLPHKIKDNPQLIKKQLTDKRGRVTTRYVRRDEPPRIEKRFAVEPGRVDDDGTQLYHVFDTHRPALVSGKLSGRHHQVVESVRSETISDWLELYLNNAGKSKVTQPPLKARRKLDELASMALTLPDGLKQLRAHGFDCIPYRQDQVAGRWALVDATINAKGLAPNPGDEPFLILQGELDASFVEVANRILSEYREKYLPDNAEAGQAFGESDYTDALANSKAQTMRSAALTANDFTNRDAKAAVVEAAQKILGWGMQNEVAKVLEPEDEDSAVFLAKLETWASDEFKPGMLQNPVGEGERYLTRCTPEDEAAIQKRLNDTHDNRTHGSFSIKLEAAFDIEYDHDGFDAASAQLGNVQSFYHGVNKQRALSAVATGLKTPKDVGVVVGSMYGQGIYFASQSSKSAQYITDSFGRGAGDGILLECDAVMGNTYKAKKKMGNGLDGLGPVPDEFDEAVSRVHLHLADLETSFTDPRDFGRMSIDVREYYLKGYPTLTGIGSFGSNIPKGPRADTYSKANTAVWEAQVAKADTLRELVDKPFKKIDFKRKLSRGKSLTCADAVSGLILDYYQMHHDNRDLDDGEYAVAADALKNALFSGEFVPTYTLAAAQQADKIIKDALFAKDGGVRRFLDDRFNEVALDKVVESLLDGITETKMYDPIFRGGAAQIFMENVKAGLDVLATAPPKKDTKTLDDAVQTVDKTLTSTLLPLTRLSEANVHEFDADAFFGKTFEKRPLTPFYNELEARSAVLEGVIANLAVKHPETEPLIMGQTLPPGDVCLPLLDTLDLSSLGGELNKVINAPFTAAERKQLAVEGGLITEAADNLANAALPNAEYSKAMTRLKQETAKILDADQTPEVVARKLKELYPRLEKELEAALPHAAALIGFSVASSSEVVAQVYRDQAYKLETRRNEASALVHKHLEKSLTEVQENLKDLSGILRSPEMLEKLSALEEQYYDSLTALTRRDGGAVENPEYVVYDKDQAKIRRVLLVHRERR